MLHLIFQTPIEIAILDRIEVGDAVVFVGNSAVSLLRQGCLAEKLAAMANDRSLSVLSDDLVARGIAANTLVEGIEVIGYSGLVALTLDHEVIQSWL